MNTMNNKNEVAKDIYAEKIIKKIKNTIAQAIRDEWVLGVNDELSKSITEFWFSTSPFVGMGGKEFLIDLRNFIRELLRQELQKFAEAIKLDKSTIERKLHERFLDGYNQAIKELNQKIKNYLGTYDKEKREN